MQRIDDSALKGIAEKMSDLTLRGYVTGGNFGPNATSLIRRECSQPPPDGFDIPEALRVIREHLTESATRLLSMLNAHDNDVLPALLEGVRNLLSEARANENELSLPTATTTTLREMNIRFDPDVERLKSAVSIIFNASKKERGEEAAGKIPAHVLAGARSAELQHRQTLGPNY